MPYIDQLTRGALLCNTLEELKQQMIDLGPGDMNFVISTLIVAKWKSAPSYRIGNEIVGILECAKQEFVRRYLNPYEDKAIKRNGDLNV